MKQEQKDIKGLVIVLQPKSSITLKDGTQLQNKENQCVEIVINTKQTNHNGGKNESEQKSE